MITLPAELQKPVVPSQDTTPPVAPDLGGSFADKIGQAAATLGIQPQPAQPQAPVQPAPQTDTAPSGGFANRLGTALKTAVAHPAAPQVLSQTGGWSKLL